METISEEQVLHNELSFEINQELIHLMKRIVEIQRTNEVLQQKVNQPETNRDEAIAYINNCLIGYEEQYEEHTFNYPFVRYDLENFLEILERGKEC